MRIHPLPYRKVERALRRLGFQAVRQQGSHVRFVHPDGRSTTVPRHGRQAIGPGLLRMILRDCRLEWPDFLART